MKRNFLVFRTTADSLLEGFSSPCMTDVATINRLRGGNENHSAGGFSAASVGEFANLPYGASCGYYPSGGLGLLLVILVVAKRFDESQT